jgi:hypothetical protein
VVEALGVIAVIAIVDFLVIFVISNVRVADLHGFYF